MDRKLLYIAVVLDKRSRDILLKATENALKLFEKDKYKLYCHHMTVAIGGAISQDLYNYAKQHEGETFSIKPTTIGCSKDALAIAVQCECPSTNKIKHITLCTFNGARPVESNNIKYWNPTKFVTTEALTGKLQFIYNK